MDWQRLWPWGFTGVVRAGGFVGAMYEVFVDKLDRPALLALLGAMMGLADRAERSRKNGSK